jgi:hypothetical protein
LFSAVTIGLGGVVYAVALRRGDDPSAALALIFGVMVSVALVGARMAGRVVVPAGLPGAVVRQPTG